MYKGMALSLLFVVGVHLPPLLAQPTSAKTHRVEIKAFTFSPAKIEMTIGDTITWVNQDFAPHTATFDADGWETPSLKKDESGAFTASKTGNFAYHCKFHPQMKGVIMVK